VAEKLFYVGVKGLIKNKKGEYLLLKADVANHSRGTKVYWDIPGGRIEEGQTQLETLKREIQEETGINGISNIEFFTSVISHHEIPISDGKAGLVLMIYVVSIPEDSSITLNPIEHSSYEWVNAKETAERLSNKYPAEFTQKLR
jgi:8-oxo-dGTP pyrophosphatase MutT (NUDIX family)